ncbi:unnamed protein product, partial [marine sediment metagenome]
WKLDPVIMQQLNQKYGPVNWDDPNTNFPLDWRNADSHAIYWAVKGLETVLEDAYSTEEAHTDRVINHSLQSLFRRGKTFIYTIPAGSVTDSSSTPTKSAMKTIFFRPDLRMFESYNKSTLKILEKYRTGKKKTRFQGMQNGHRNMLKNAAFSFYQAGLIRQAQRIYGQLKQLYPRPEFDVPLVVFAKNRLRYELQSLDITSARELIQMMLRESYFRFAVRDDDEAANREKLAQGIYDYYQSEFAIDAEETERV